MREYLMKSKVKNITAHKNCDCRMEPQNFQIPMEKSPEK